MSFRARACAVAILAIGSLGSTAAIAQSENPLIGLWCGQPGNPYLTNLRFTSSELIVISRDNGSRKTFRIQKYEPRGPYEMVVHYYGSSSNEKGGTPGTDTVFMALYERISADGSTMWQAAGVNPAYAYKRCRG
jgi:hypothetical protein